MQSLRQSTKVDYKVWNDELSDFSPRIHFHSAIPKNLVLQQVQHHEDCPSRGDYVPTGHGAVSWLPTGPHLPVGRGPPVLPGAWGRACGPWGPRRRMVGRVVVDTSGGFRGLQDLLPHLRRASRASISGRRRTILGRWSLAGRWGIPSGCWNRTCGPESGGVGGGRWPGCGALCHLEVKKKWF